MPDSWQTTEIASLAKAIAFCYRNQNTYKEPLDLDVRVAGWRFVLEEEFSVEQVLYGLREFMKKSTDMAVAANIYKILNPEPPKVTEAQFVQAQRWQERNGYPIFSDALTTIAKYHEQNKQAQKGFESECKRIDGLVNNSVKRISS